MRPILKEEGGYRSDPKIVGSYNQPYLTREVGGYNFLATWQNLLMPMSEKAVGNFPHFMERSEMVGNFPHSMGIMDD